MTRKKYFHDRKGLMGNLEPDLSHELEPSPPDDYIELREEQERLMEEYHPALWHFIKKHGRQLGYVIE